MARIDLNTPYEEFLKSQVESGLFRSVTAAAEHAIHQQMIAHEERRISSVHHAILKGEESIVKDAAIPYSSELMDQAMQKAREIASSGKPIKKDIRP